MGEVHGENLAARLISIGRDAGLDACGICSARPFDEARRALEEGLRAGRDGGMQFTYRNPGRSCEPARSLPGARALFVGAKGYARAPLTRPRDATRPPRPTGSVAMYSWSDHYGVLRSALGKVAERLSREGWRSKILVDDNALVDRAAAVRAGIGWYGKNTNVLIPRHGSLFVLGSVVTDAPIEVVEPAPAVPPDPGGLRTPGPVADGCGSCRRCVESCPTGALDGEGHLDARRCLAWLLQAPGVFPRDLRVAVGARIYGCDDCQDACPVNTVAFRRRGMPPADDDAVEDVDLVALLDAGDEELLDRYGRWYIPKRDPAYLRRNALLALANTADPGSAEVEGALAGALRHRDPLVRAHAVWAAARLGRADLMDLVSGDRAPEVLDELRRAGTVRTREACGT